MRLLLLVLAIAFTIGCSNDFELNEPKVETPVVYGILDPADANQFIRVERAFADPAISAVEIAQNADSLYYDNITVKLVKEGQEYIGEQVDGADFGLPRDTDGTFASSPNTLYRFDTESLELETGQAIDLVIEGVFEDRPVTSATTVIDRPGVSFPSPEGGSEFDFIEGQPLRFNWGAREGNVLYALELQFNFIEVRGGEQVEKSIVWPLANSVEETEFTLDPQEFYQFIGGAFEAEEDVLRFIVDADYKLTAGDNSLADLDRIAGSNLGITSSGEVPTYTNITEGLGIFGAKHSYLISDVGLGGDTKDSLRNGRFTKDLNFQ